MLNQTLFENVLLRELWYLTTELFHHRLFNKPWYKNAYSPNCSPYISYRTSKENLFKYQDISSLVITSFILITWMFE